jgi:hypothetical protein
MPDVRAHSGHSTSAAPIPPNGAARLEARLCLSATRGRFRLDAPPEPRGRTTTAFGHRRDQRWRVDRPPAKPSPIPRLRGRGPRAAGPRRRGGERRPGGAWLVPRRALTGHQHSGRSSPQGRSTTRRAARFLGRRRPKPPNRDPPARRALLQSRRQVQDVGATLASINDALARLAPPGGSLPQPLALISRIRDVQRDGLPGRWQAIRSREALRTVGEALDGL